MITLPRSCNIYTCGTSGAPAWRLVGRIVGRNRAYGEVDQPDAHAMLAELEAGETRFTAAEGDRPMSPPPDDDRFTSLEADDYGDEEE